MRTVHLNVVIKFSNVLNRLSLSESVSSLYAVLARYIFTKPIPLNIVFLVLEVVGVVQLLSSAVQPRRTATVMLYQDKTSFPKQNILLCQMI